MTPYFPGEGEKEGVGVGQKGALGPGEECSMNMKLESTSIPVSSPKALHTRLHFPGALGEKVF